MKPGVIVGLFVERSIEMVVGVLGILKSGAAYVPMDPAFPAERLTAMIEDAAMPIIVTQSSLAGTLATNPDITSPKPTVNTNNGKYVSPSPIMTPNEAASAWQTRRLCDNFSDRRSRPRSVGGTASVVSPFTLSVQSF